MKSSLDQTMQENDVDALWVIGSMYNNPDMVYFTGIHHVNQVDLIKIRGKEPIAYHQVSMEREEARRSGLETHPYDEYRPLTDYLEKSNGDPLAAMAERTRDVFHHIGLTKGRVAISGLESLAYALGFIEIVESLMPEIEFLSIYQGSPIRRARQTKTPEEVEHIRRMGQLTVEVVARTADFLKSNHLKEDILVNDHGNAITIADVKQHINLWLAELGADNPEETIFSIGRDAGVPHNTGNPQDIIRAGQPIIFDIFPCEKGGGYFYDFTRTWCVGYAPPEVQKLHQQVALRSPPSHFRIEAQSAFQQVPNQNLRVVPAARSCDRPAAAWSDRGLRAQHRAWIGAGYP